MGEVRKNPHKMKLPMPPEENNPHAPILVSITRATHAATLPYLIRSNPKTNSHHCEINRRMPPAPLVSYTKSRCNITLFFTYSTLSLFESSPSRNFGLPPGLHLLQTRHLSWSALVSSCTTQCYVPYATTRLSVFLAGTISRFLRRLRTLSTTGYILASTPLRSTYLGCAIYSIFFIKNWMFLGLFLFAKKNEILD